LGEGAIRGREWEMGKGESRGSKGDRNENAEAACKECWENRALGESD